MSMMDIDGLALYHHNPRRGNVPLIAESLATLGQYRPITVNRGTLTGRPFEVLVGNQTLTAARRLGWSEIDIHLVDVTDDDAARIVVVDNRASDLAVYDDSELRALLDSMPNLEATGWTEEERDALREKLDATGPPPELREPGPVAAHSKWEDVRDEDRGERLDTHADAFARWRAMALDEWARSVAPHIGSKLVDIEEPLGIEGDLTLAFVRA